jgi:hypothetical protein
MGGFAGGPGGAAAAAGVHPNFKYHTGGRVVRNARVRAFFIGDWTSTANQDRATRLQQFLQDYFVSTRMNLLSQYGCGTAPTLVDTLFRSSSDHDLSNADVHGIMQAAIDDNSMPEPSAGDEVCVLFLDDATAVHDGSITMCAATSDNAFGYHNHFATTAGNDLPFAVVPGLTDTCLQDSCSSDGTCSLHLTQTREQRQTQVTSHEFDEMVSDPDLNAWFEDGTGNENGDICNGQAGSITVGPNTWTVQLEYSKWHDQQTSGTSTCLVGADAPTPSLLPACTVVVDRSVYGKDEIDALLHLSNPGHIEAAFYVVVDGFTPAQLGITAASLGGVPNVQPAFSTSPGLSGVSFEATSLVAEDSTLAGGIQRFTWICRTSFTSSAAFPPAAGGDTPVTLTATVSTQSGSGRIDLIHEPNPYENDGPTSWLSTDVRVFRVNAGGQAFGATMGAAAADAPAFIQQAITNLNTHNTTVTGGQTFEGLPTDEQTAFVELSEQVSGTRVFNFALAKVRYRSLTAQAPDVGVFFRLFPAATTSTDYHQATTYRRSGTGAAAIPMLGIQDGHLATIPCFASARVDTATASMTTQSDGPNRQTLTGDPSGNEVTRYYGCWLDINQPSQPQFPIIPGGSDGPFSTGRLTIQELVRNAHQCLVAEIAFDPDPIRDGVGPGASDKLAQRNLSIVASDNPGAPASHRIPTTFEVRPTSAKLGAAAVPDELLLDWRQVPEGSTATVFLPGASATDIIVRADALYVSHHLVASDEHTLTFPASGLTYLPIPLGEPLHLPGLLTVDLPPTVHKGHTFGVVVHQLTGAVARVPKPPPDIGSESEKAKDSKGEDGVIRFRRVVGSFQLSIPVSARATLLGPEVRLLAVSRWILHSIPADDRWHPVFTRYVDTIAERVRALGGDPERVKPDPTGGDHQPQRDHDEDHHYRREHEVRGKVTEVRYDCVGDFIGFVLWSCCERHAFRSTRPGVERLLLKALSADFTVAIRSDRHGAICEVTIHGGAADDR